MLHVRTLARRCFMDERAAVPVALAGGLLSKGSLVRKRLEQRLREIFVIEGGPEAESR